MRTLAAVLGNGSVASPWWVGASIEFVAELVLDRRRERAVDQRIKRFVEALGVVAEARTMSAATQGLDRIMALWPALLDASLSELDRWTAMGPERRPAPSVAAAWRLDRATRHVARDEDVREISARFTYLKATTRTLLRTEGVDLRAARRELSRADSRACLEAAPWLRGLGALMALEVAGASDAGRAVPEAVHCLIDVALIGLRRGLVPVLHGGLEDVTAQLARMWEHGLWLNSPLLAQDLRGLASQQPEAPSVAAFLRRCEDVQSPLIYVGDARDWLTAAIAREFGPAWLRRVAASTVWSAGAASTSTAAQWAGLSQGDFLVATQRAGLCRPPAAFALAPAERDAILDRLLHAADGMPLHGPEADARVRDEVVASQRLEGVDARIHTTE